MYTLMLSDLDETLLVEHHVPLENREAIAKARKRGLKFIPATGRAYNMITTILQEIGTYNKEDEYSICFNGGLIVENKNHKILRFQGVSFDLTKELFSLAGQYDVGVLVFTLDMCYMFHPDESEIQRKQQQKAAYTVVEDDSIEFLREENIAKILFQKRDMPYLKQIEKEIPEELKKQLSISYSSNRYLEFNAPGITKGEALTWMVKYLDMDQSKTIAIGDNYNDVEMIKAANLGIAVTSAAKDIQELADYITENDYDQGAVKEVIEKFILEER